MRNFAFALTFLLFLATPLATTLAQLPGTELAEFVITPENPGPNERVVVKINSYAIDINRADISWTLDGNTAQSGKGLRTFEFETGSVGTKNTLEVLIVSFEGYPLSKTFNFYPAEVTLVSEAESYTPPFYKGHSYFPYQGVIRVVALPNFTDQNGVKITNGELVFNWKNGSQLLRDSSGFGKETLIFHGSIPARSNTISVEVSSLDGKYFATKSIELSPVEPKVVLYENHPEYGLLYNKALANSFSLTKEELQLSAVPLFFGVTESNNPNLKFEWNLNGKIIGDTDNSIILKNPGNSAGQAILSLQLSNSIDIFQFANATLSIKFGNVQKSFFD